MGAGAQTGMVNVDPHPAPSGAPHPLSRLSAPESPDMCPDLRDVIPFRREGKGEGGIHANATAWPQPRAERSLR